MLTVVVYTQHHPRAVLSVPEWIPGLSHIRREASRAYALSIKMIETPYRLVQERMVSFT